MKIITAVFMILFVLSFVGCSNNVGCNVEKLVVDQTTGFISSQLKCDAEAVKLDVVKVVEKMNLCKDGEQSLGPVLCKTAAGMLVDSLVVAGIPAAWKCDPSATVEKVKEAIYFGCDQIK